MGNRQISDRKGVGNTGWPFPAALASRPQLLVFFVLLLAVLFAYGDIFTHQFVAYDDQRIIVGHAQRYDGVNRETLRRVFVEDFPREEPLLLRDLSYQLNAQIFGVLNPAGYLLGNVLLHVGVAFLVFLLGLEFFPADLRPALLAAMLFAVHPLHTEAVAWISARKDTLYTFFYLSALLCYCRWHTRPSGKYLSGSVLLFILALFSKAAAISFLPVVLCYRLTVGRQRRGSWLEGAYYGTVCLLTLVFVWWYTGVLRQFGVLGEDLTSPRDLGGWVLVAGQSVGFYVQKIMLPTRLSAVYDFPIGLSRSASILLLVNVGFFVAIGLGFAVRGRGNGLGQWLVAWFFLALLPYLDLARVGIYVADRYAYLASIPFLLLLACLLLRGIDTIWDRGRGWRLAVITGLLLCLGLAVQQTASSAAVWQNSITLWSNVRRQAPDNLSSYAALMGEYLKLYRSAPERPDAALFLAAARGVGEDAEARFSQGDRYAKALHLVTVQLAQVAWLEKDWLRAEHYCRLTLQLNPQYGKGRLVYAGMLAAMGRAGPAREQLNWIRDNAHPQMEHSLRQQASRLLDSLGNPQQVGSPASLEAVQ